MSDLLGIQTLRSEQARIKDKIIKFTDSVPAAEWAAEHDEKLDRMKAEFVAIGNKANKMQEFHNQVAAQQEYADSVNGNPAFDHTTALQTGKPGAKDQKQVFENVFEDWLRNCHSHYGNSSELAFQMAAEKHGLVNVSTGASPGQEAVVEQIVGSFMSYLRGAQGMAQIVDVQTRDGLGGAEGIRQPVFNDTTYAKVVAEGSNTSEADTSMHQVVAKADRYTSQIIPITNQALEDDSVGGLLAQVQEEALGRMTAALDRAYCIKPTGNDYVLSSATVNGVGAFDAESSMAGGFTINKTTAANNAITESDLRSLWGEMKEGHRSNGTWAMSTATYITVLSVREAPTAVGNERLVRRAGEGESNGALFGRPIALSDHVPDFAASARAIGFGNWRLGYKSWLIRQGSNLIVYNGDEYKKKDSIGVEYKQRAASRPINYQAVGILDIKS